VEHALEARPLLGVARSDAEQRDVDVGRELVLHREQAHVDVVDLARVLVLGRVDLADLELLVAVGLEVQIRTEVVLDVFGQVLAARHRLAHFTGLSGRVVLLAPVELHEVHFDGKVRAALDVEDPLAFGTGVLADHLRVHRLRRDEVVVLGHLDLEAQVGLVLVPGPALGGAWPSAAQVSRSTAATPWAARIRDGMAIMSVLWEATRRTGRRSAARRRSARSSSPRGRPGRKPRQVPGDSTDGRFPSFRFA
jgi:hypothetical protein